MIKLGILGSTKGTSMQSILTAIEQHQLQARIEVVLSDKSDAFILTRAEQHQLPAYFINPKGISREQFDQQLSDQLRAHGVEYILLIGYARILSALFIRNWQHRIFNVHPSLLPAFANMMDLAVHEAVLNSAVTETGCTVHEVTEEVDQGPIFLQKRCPVYANDTIFTLKERVQEQEKVALVEAVEKLASTIKRENLPMPLSTIKRALISVSNKQGLIPFVKALHNLGIEIISTGGTCATLREAAIPVTDVPDVTQFPEIMDGRVKTLHPKIHGGILGKRDVHANIAKQHNIEWIDLVVVNLYPFAETIQNPSTRLEDAIEQIDIGGPAMIRSAAKNMQFVTVVVDPADYEAIIQALQADGEIKANQRKALARKAFEYTARYDYLIQEYLANQLDEPAPIFPSTLLLPLTKQADLRYGENPEQKACAYFMGDTPQGLLNAVIHQGKELSYNNLVDVDAASDCVREFTSPACVIVKHANPCGIALNETPALAFRDALAADPTSAFGGIVALNRSCDAATAQAISKVFFEVIIAPAYSAEALAIFANKPNQRVLEWGENHSSSEPHSKWHYQRIDGGLLVQEKLIDTGDLKHFTVPTQRKPTQQELNALIFAWRVVKYIKSNAIVITNEHQTIGIGAGQVSRIDAVDLAIRKAQHDLNTAALASDAFFPFRDGIDRIAEANIPLVIQPGGSIRDQEVIQACNEHNIAMVFTGIRCFRH